jgi:L-lactate dehydrogenase complex protein LldG
MNPRDEILRALGAVSGAAPLPPPVYAPDPEDDGDLFGRFAASLEAAGGRARLLPDAHAFDEALRAHPERARARSIWSTRPELPSRLDSGTPHAPRDLSDLDVALLDASLAVAETGAVWWSPRDAFERAAGLLALHVVLVVPRTALVTDLHAAYARIDVAGAAFGAFVCGPSKTADIEQALVIGAHGPRSLEVWLVERV